MFESKIRCIELAALSAVVGVMACGTTQVAQKSLAPADGAAPKVVVAAVELHKKIENGFFHYTLKAADGEVLNVYGGDEHLGKKNDKPLLVVVSGSGCRSIFRKNKEGKLKRGLAGLFRSVVRDKMSVVALEKRGVALGDSKRGGGAHCSKLYHRHAGHEARKADYLHLIAALNPYHPKVFVLGFSEGTDVGSAVVAESKDVDGLGFMSGGGPTQAFDFFVMFRKRMRGADPKQVEANITKLYAMLADVFKDPTSETKMLFGHPYKRWASYFRRPSIEALVKIDAPIFVAHGSADTSVPIESADYIAAEFLRLGKTNLTYKRYPGLNHSFYSCSPRDKGCDPAKANRLPDVIKDFMDWAVGVKGAR